MRSRLELHPDLNECVLEDRTLLSYTASLSPFILTTGGFVVLTTPPGLSSALNTASGGSAGGGGNSGGNMPTSFNIAGFGPTSFAIGNSVGFPGVAGGAGLSGTGTTVTGNLTVGSGANEPGTSGGAAGYGGSFAAGYNFGLNSQNNFGMGSSPVGALAAYAPTSGGTVQPQPQDPSAVDPNATTNPNPPAQDTSGTDMKAGSSSTTTTGPGTRMKARSLGGSNSLLIGPNRSQK